LKDQDGDLEEYALSQGQPMWVAVVAVSELCGRIAAHQSQVAQQRSGLTVGDTSACQTLRTAERYSSPIDWL